MLRRTRRKSTKGVGIKKAERIYGFIFALPAIVFFAVFYFLPIIKTLQISFYRWDFLSPPAFEGLRNYVVLLKSSEFHNSLWKSFYYAFGTTIPIWFIALGLAVLFNRITSTSWLYLVVYYIPVVVPLIVACIVWQIMYHPSYGMLTLITRPLGFVDIPWLTSSRLAMPSIILLSIWKGTPFYMVIYLAGLVSIPREYTEAAQIDGANKYQVFRHITIPLLKPVILYVIVISIIAALQVFDPFYVMTKGGPGSATRVVTLFVNETAFQYLKVGTAAAASLVFFGLVLCLSLVILKFFRSSWE
jgi:multiple sugar transport system permease protein